MFIVEVPPKKVVIDWVKKNWLNAYYEMKLLATSMNHPKVIASYTDMPYYGTGGKNSSSTESNAVRKVSAEEWISVFHNALNQLPDLQKEIIEKTYLKNQTDIAICRELHIGRTFYFERRNEGLYWLGLALWHKSDKSQ